VVYIHSVMKKNENMFVDKCMELENIMLSEVSWAQKLKCYIFPSMGNLNQQVKSIHEYIYDHVYIHIYA
jgi:hypothetical protein